MEMPDYIHLTPGEAPPRLDGAGRFKAILVVESDVTPEWQAVVSDWLVRSGCRYLMAWGRRCSEWDDSVDDASLRLCDGGSSDDAFVMTTWHDEESLADTFFYAAHTAMHPFIDLKRTCIIHIAPDERSDEFLRVLQDAQGNIEGTSDSAT